MIWNFDETVVSMLPEGDVPYSGHPPKEQKISDEVRNMHLTGSFSMGSSDKNGHTTIRREYKNFITLFVEEMTLCHP